MNRPQISLVDFVLKSEQLSAVDQLTEACFNILNPSAVFILCRLENVKVVVFLNAHENSEVASFFQKSSANVPVKVSVFI